MRTYGHEIQDDLLEVVEDKTTVLDGDRYRFEVIPEKNERSYGNVSSSSSSFSRARVLPASFATSLPLKNDEVSSYSKN